MPKMVGVKYPLNTGTYDRPFDYKDIIKEKDGWIDASKYLPKELDLVMIRADGCKPYPGWYSRLGGWDGRRYNVNHKILAWKRDKKLCNYDIT